MALTKERKEEALARYQAWLKDSQGIVLTEYIGLDMPAMDSLRRKVREAGGEFHVFKNTLAQRAFKAAGLDAPAEYFTASTAIGLAFEDPPAVAKAIADFAKQNESLKIKGGFLGAQLMSAAEVTALAELPPLPVVRSQMLAMFNTPATQLARLLSEPGRQVAQVLKAYADKAPAAA